MSGDDDKMGERYFEQAYALKNTEETREFYARWASVYDQEIEIEKGYAQPGRCAAALISVLEEKHEPVIDIGCGTGLSGKAIAEAGFTTIDGCDLSVEMLEKAQATGCYRRLFVTDLNRPPIDAPDGMYAAATCVGVFSFGHVEPDAIDEILRLLRPQGFLIIGLNDHFFDEGRFPAKLEALERQGRLEVLQREHGTHLKNVEGSTGWVITCRKSD